MRSRIAKFNEIYKCPMCGYSTTLKFWVSCFSGRGNIFTCMQCGRSIEINRLMVLDWECVSLAQTAEMQKHLKDKFVQCPKCLVWNLESVWLGNYVNGRFFKCPGRCGDTIELTQKDVSGEEGLAWFIACKLEEEFRVQRMKDQRDIAIVTQELQWVRKKYEQHRWITERLEKVYERCHSLMSNRPSLRNLLTMIGNHSFVPSVFQSFLRRNVLE